MNCPRCGAELKCIGYPKDGVQYYECPNGCRPTLTWRIREGLRIALYIIALMILVIYVAVVTFPVSIYRKVRG